MTILRPASIYGPRGTAFVTDVVKLLREGSMALFDGGRVRGGFCYVDNVAHAMMAAATSGNTIGRAYNIADETNITWKQYVMALAEGIGAKEPWLNLPSAWRCVWDMQWRPRIACCLCRAGRCLRAMLCCCVRVTRNIRLSVPGTTSIFVPLSASPRAWSARLRG